MARRKKQRTPTHPGGPGAMAALRRAQEKLKALGIKLYKHTPEAAKPKKPAPEEPAPPKSAPAKGEPSQPATKAAKAPAKPKEAAPGPAKKSAKSSASPKKARR